eukprot:848388-Alexandrium_andersonii.AAC.1
MRGRDRSFNARFSGCDVAAPGTDELHGAIGTASYSDDAVGHTRRPPCQCWRPKRRRRAVRRLV